MTGSVRVSNSLVWRIVFAVAVASASVFRTGTVEASLDVYEGPLGSLVTSGFFRTQVDIHTGRRNPNNPGFERSTLLLSRQWMLEDFDWKTPIPGLKVFVRSRFWLDTTSKVDGDVPNFNAFPTSYSGDGWFVRAHGNDGAAEIWEGWADYTRGDWWFRVGRQTVVWGDVSPGRLLDDINPLDVSWHVVLEPLGKDVFDHLRIPIWAARVGYTLPFLADHYIEGFVAPPFAFIGTQIPASGSPLNLVGLPDFIRLRDNVADGQTGVAAGGRLIGTVGGLNYTIAGFTRHNGEGITRTQAFVPDPSSPIGGILFLQQQHPRFETVGFSVNHFEQWSKIVTRVEAIWDISRPWENLKPASGGEIIRRNTWAYIVAFDRPGFYIRSDRTASATIQFEHHIRENGVGKLGSAGFPVPPNSELILLLFGQAFRGFAGRGDEFFGDLAFLVDLDQAYIFTPLLRYEPGNHWRFNIWYNTLWGPNRHPPTNANPGGFGINRWQQGLNLSVTYQF